MLRGLVGLAQSGWIERSSPELPYTSTGGRRFAALSAAATLMRCTRCASESDEPWTEEADDSAESSTSTGQGAVINASAATAPVCRCCLTSSMMRPPQH